MVGSARFPIVALLVAAALVLHLLMLAAPALGGTDGQGSGHGFMQLNMDSSGDGEANEAEDGHPGVHMLWLCLAVLGIVATAAGVLPRRRWNSVAVGLFRSAAAQLSFQLQATSRDGPASPSRVDGGVLLRV